MVEVVLQEKDRIMLDNDDGVTTARVMQQVLRHGASGCENVQVSQGVAS